MSVEFPETTETTITHGDQDITVTQYDDQQYCSMDCADEDNGEETNTCRLCGTVLSSDHDGECCNRCAKLVKAGSE